VHCVVLYLKFLTWQYSTVYVHIGDGDKFHYGEYAFEEGDKKGGKRVRKGEKGLRRTRQGMIHKKDEK
jgi:hypothetical protein